MTITAIRYKVYADDLFSDTAGADVLASAVRFRDMLETRLEERFPDAELDLTVLPGSSGAGSYGDSLIIGESDKEEDTERENFNDLVEDVWLNETWIVEEEKGH